MRRFLVNEDFKFNEFKSTIKKRLELDEKTSTLFIYSGSTFINEDQTLKQIYEKHQDPEDGFLYLTYRDSEVFGQ